MKIFTSSLWELFTNYVLEWMGLNSYDYDGLHFTSKNECGNDNEHECKQEYVNGSLLPKKQNEEFI